MSNMNAHNIRPEYVNSRYYFDQAIYEDRERAVLFSHGVIKDLFGFNDDLCKNCMVFAESSDPKLASAFMSLWYAAFGAYQEKVEIPWNAVFNYETGRSLLEKARHSITKYSIEKDVAQVRFVSCINTAGFPNWKGYANFDFITALAILDLKSRHPNIQRVQANLYFNSFQDIPLKNMDFPVEVESTEDQRYIYSLINSR